MNHRPLLKDELHAAHVQPETSYLTPHPKIIQALSRAIPFTGIGYTHRTHRTHQHKGQYHRKYHLRRHPQHNLLRIHAKHPVEVPGITGQEASDKKVVVNVQASSWRINVVDNMHRCLTCSRLRNDQTINRHSQSQAPWGNCIPKSTPQSSKSYAFINVVTNHDQSAPHVPKYQQHRPDSRHNRNRRGAPFAPIAYTRRRYGLFGHHGIGITICHTTESNPGSTIHQGHAGRHAARTQWIIRFRRKCVKRRCRCILAGGPLSWSNRSKAIVRSQHCTYELSSGRIEILQSTTFHP